MRYPPGRGLGARSLRKISVAEVENRPVRSANSFWMSPCAASPKSGDHGRADRSAAKKGAEWFFGVNHSGPFFLHPHFLGPAWFKATFYPHKRNTPRKRTVADHRDILVVERCGSIACRTPATPYKDARADRDRQGEARSRSTTGRPRLSRHWRCQAPESFVFGIRRGRLERPRQNGLQAPHRRSCRYFRPNSFSISPCASFTQVGRPWLH